MARTQVIFSIVLCLLLAGCSQGPNAVLQKHLRQCEATNTTLEKQLDALDNHAQKLTTKTKELEGMFNRYQLDASIYQGCESFDGFLSGLCPSSAMENGPVAIAQYKFPGGGWPYWIALTGKLSVLVIAFAIALTVVARLYFKHIEPQYALVQDKINTVKNAQNELEKMKAKYRTDTQKHEDIIQQLNAEIDRLHAEISNMEMQEASARADAESRKQEISRLDQLIIEKKAVLDTLSGFQ